MQVPIITHAQGALRRNRRLLSQSLPLPEFACGRSRNVLDPRQDFMGANPSKRL